MKTPEYIFFGYDGPKWAFYYYFIKFYHISLGLHIDLYQPNIEIHLPFGFIRIGRVNRDCDSNLIKQFYAIKKLRKLN